MTPYDGMAESSNATLSGHYQGSHVSCGGYNKSDDQLTLPNYMDHDPTNNPVIYQVDVLKEMNETGYGSDQDIDLFGVCNIDNTMRGVENSGSRYIILE